MFFSIQDCLSEGTNVEHFMKWSTNAIRHREQGGCAKNCFPQGKKYSEISNMGFFHEKYWIMTSERFHRKVFVKNSPQTVL